MEPIIKHLNVDFSKPENLLSESSSFARLSFESSTKASPLFVGKYTLTVETYKTRPGAWDYTWGKITKDGELVASIQRNYPHFLCQEIGDESLVVGSRYIQSSIIDLKSRTSWDSPNDDFCWITTSISPHRKTLAVTGCIWGDPTELQFYDLSAGGTTSLKQDFDLPGVNEPEELSDEEKAQWPSSSDPRLIEIEWISDTRLLWKHKTLWYTDLKMWYPEAYKQIGSGDYLESINKLDQLKREFRVDQI